MIRLPLILGSLLALLIKDSINFSDKSYFAESISKLYLYPTSSKVLYSFFTPLSLAKVSLRNMSIRN